MLLHTPGSITDPSERNTPIRCRINELLVQLLEYSIFFVVFHIGARNWISCWLGKGAGISASDCTRLAPRSLALPTTPARNVFNKSSRRHRSAPVVAIERPHSCCRRLPLLLHQLHMIDSMIFLERGRHPLTSRLCVFDCFSVPELATAYLRK